MLTYNTQPMPYVKALAFKRIPFIQAHTVVMAKAMHLYTVTVSDVAGWASMAGLAAYERDILNKEVVCVCVCIIGGNKYLLQTTVKNDLMSTDEASSTE